MNYLRGAFNAASQYYRDLPPINPSTLTGAIDVIVVEHLREDGEAELACTPFHVRFGKWQVLRPGEKKVDIKVNGQPVPFNMKIGDAGEAFFVFETDDDIPDDLVTSPILSAVQSPMELESSDVKNSNNASARKSLHGRGKINEDIDLEPLDLGLPAPSDHISSSLSSIPLSKSPMDDNQPDVPSNDIRFSNTMKKATTLGKVVIGAALDTDQDAPRMVDRIRGAKNTIFNGRIESKTSDSVLSKGDEALPEVNEQESSPPTVILANNTALDIEGYHSENVNLKSTDRKNAWDGIIKETPSAEYSPSSSPLNVTRAIHTARATSEPPELSLSSSPQYSWDWGSFPQRTPVQENFSSNHLDLHRSSSVPPELDGEHLTAHSAWVDDNSRSPGTSLDEEGELTADEENGRRFLLQLGNRIYEFELSTCGPLNGKDIIEDTNRFKEHQISYRQFMKHSAIIDDDNLVMQWNDRFITKRDSSSIMAILPMWRRTALAKHRRIDDASDEPTSSSDEREPLQRSALDEMPKQSASSWVRWWKSTRTEPESSSKVSESPQNIATPTESASSTPLPACTHSPSNSMNISTSSPIVHPKRYAKTLRLASQQLKALNLKHGSNTITFSLSASGAVACTAHIFLWDSTCQIVVSDIDGTITKSDALGHVLTMIGRDWTHLGVAKLYTDIRKNGYKIMYLTSRAIGQADSTREYLKGINQNNYQLPDGPVIMSPDRLLASLHREVIMRKPEVFKMACLRDIQRLFSAAGRNPFYAGFGNRMTDALSYRSVSIPSARIFTIDSSSEVKMELLELAGYKSSYIHMADLVDQMFPPINRAWTPEYTDFNYWKQPIQNYPLPDLLPPSPALSATSDASNQGTFTRIRNFSLGRQSGSQLTFPRSSSQTPSASEARLRKLSSFDYLRERLLGSSELSQDDSETEGRAARRLSSGSVPGSLPDLSVYQEDEVHFGNSTYEAEEETTHREEFDEEVEVAEQTFDDDLFAAGEMQNVPFL